MSRITFVNPSDSAWTRHRYVLAFGAYGWTILVAHANSLDDALDECIDWIVDNEPGLICDAAVSEAYALNLAANLAAGLDEETARSRAAEDAEIDTTVGGNCANRINSWEWSIVAEDPDRACILKLAGRV